MGHEDDNPSQTNGSWIDCDSSVFPYDRPATYQTVKILEHLRVSFADLRANYF